MPELKEVFEMTTKQIEPDVDAWREQEGHQRRSTRNKRIGAFAIAAAVIGVLAIGLILAIRSESHKVPADQPSGTSPPKALPEVSVPSFLDLRTGAVTALAKGIPTLGRDYAVSPDRKMVATNPCCDHPAPVWVANMDGTDVHEITPPGIDGFGPRWSPDGSKLVYQERDAVTEEIGNLVVFDVATGKRTQVTDLPRASYGLWFMAPTFTPDGKAILFHLHREAGLKFGEGWDLWSVPVYGGKPRVVLHGRAMAAYSPDGHSLACVFPNPSSGDWSGSLQIIDPTDDSLWVPLGGAIAFPKWSPDGKRIAFQDGGGVYVLDVATRVRSRVAIGDFPEWFDNDTLIISPTG
jgi:Tol biopolymer transport system component